MPGDGTKLATTLHKPPPARLLDITRLMRRAGRVWTGIDRVELAYLERLIAEDIPLWGLARTPYGYVLLDGAGMRGLASKLRGILPFATPDLLSRIPRGLSATQRAAQTEVRKLAVGRALPVALGRMLRRRLPAGFAYLNVGHSNLTDRVFTAVREVPDARIAVLVHDVIPLTHPQFQRPGSVAPFEAKMRRVRARADLILYNSAGTQSQAERVMAGWGPVPRGIVAHLGATLTVPDSTELPQGLPPQDHYFVTVGTIEPRKNHAVLLDAWAAMGADAPPLIIVGNRGWNNDAVFARLDALDPGGPVREVSGLSDPALAALIAGAQALLFPSHAEGFGLPAIEALRLGTPVICSNIATFREILGDAAVYLEPDDWQIWASRLVDWSNLPRRSVRESGFEAPTWDAHFKIALSFT